MLKHLRRMGLLPKKDHEEYHSAARLHRSKRKEDGSRVSLSIQPPDGGWGWVIVIASFFASTFADGVTYSYGVLATEFLTEFNITRSSVGWMASTLVAITLGSGPIASHLSERFSYRAVSVVGSIICSVGFASPYFYGRLWFLFMSSSVVAGLGFGMVYLPSVVIVNEWFDKRRSFALGIAVCGSGLGTFVFSPLMDHLILRFGWQGCMLVVGCMLLFLVACSMTYINVEINAVEIEGSNLEEKETKRKKEPTKHSEDIIRKASSENEIVVRNEILLNSNFDLLKNPLFILFSFSMLLTGIGFDSPYMFAKDRAIQQGLPPNKGSFLISFMGLGNCIGRVLFGFIASKKFVNRFHLYNISLMFGGMVLISSWGLKSYVLMVVNAFIFGLITGTFVTLSSILLVDLFGLENLNIAFGLSSMIQAVAVLVGPPFIGMIYDVTLSYNIAYSICGVAIFVSGAIMYLAYLSAKFRTIKFMH